MIDAVMESAEHERVCARAAALSDRWRERAPVAETTRSIPNQTMQELHDSGLMRIVVPRRHGGLGMDWPTLVESARVGARACASTGWMISLVGGHAMFAARLPAPCQERIFAAGPRQIFCTASAPGDGTLVKEPAAVRVNGTWRFSSGIDHATWVMINAPFADSTTRDRVMLTVPAEHVEKCDAWHVSGMCGTGSKDIRFRQLLVEDQWVVPLSELFGASPEGGALHHDQYLCDVPLIPYATSGLIGPVLGCAEGALAEAMKMLEQRAPRSNATLSSIAESTAELACAARTYDSIVVTLHFAGRARRGLDSMEVAVIKRDRAYLVRLCLMAVSRLMRQFGTAVVFEANPLQRHWRDLQVMAMHMDADWDAAMSAYGQRLLPGSTDAVAPEQARAR
jgi:3-hydroxy-9,10-secoandrosta-1,3,5(10)-triene-9,17-dione monooxygenase